MSQLGTVNSSNSFPEVPMSTWRFYYREGDTENASEVSYDYCPQVVEAFFHFMRGAGFSDDTIRRGFEQLSEEYFSD